jgi:hypothetical protein
MRPHRAGLLLASGSALAPPPAACGGSRGSLTVFVSNPARAGVVFVPDLKPSGS